MVFSLALFKIVIGKQTNKQHNSMFFQFVHFLQIGQTLAKFKFEVSPRTMALTTSAFGLEETRESQHRTLQLNSRV